MVIRFKSHVNMHRERHEYIQLNMIYITKYDILLFRTTKWHLIQIFHCRWFLKWWLVVSDSLLWWLIQALYSSLSIFMYCKVVILIAWSKFCFDVANFVIVPQVIFGRFDLPYGIRKLNGNLNPNVKNKSTSFHVLFIPCSISVLAFLIDGRISRAIMRIKYVTSVSTI